MRRGDKKPEDLDRPEGNDLLSNYELHDVGHEEAVRRLVEEGYRVEEWGIDRRHDDGEEGIIFDDAMDFKVYHGDTLVGLMDVKTKSSARWMGRFNARHYDHYSEHAETFDVPAFVVMFQVDSDGNVHDEFAVHIESCDPIRSDDGTKAVYPFPDGNDAVLVPHGARLSWGFVEQELWTQAELQDL